MLFLLTVVAFGVIFAVIGAVIGYSVVNGNYFVTAVAVAVFIVMFYLFRMEVKGSPDKEIN